MKVRYKQGRKGLVAVAKVYDASEHGIDQKKIDKDAVRTVEKLSRRDTRPILSAELSATSFWDAYPRISTSQPTQPQDRCTSFSGTRA